jgi:hypothetical protein
MSSGILGPKGETPIPPSPNPLPPGEGGPPDAPEGNRHGRAISLTAKAIQSKLRPCAQKNSHWRLSNDFLKMPACTSSPRNSIPLPCARGLTNWIAEREFFTRRSSAGTSHGLQNNLGASSTGRSGRSVGVNGAHLDTTTKKTGKNKFRPHPTLSPSRNDSILDDRNKPQRRDNRGASSRRGQPKSGNGSVGRSVRGRKKLRAGMPGEPAGWEACATCLTESFRPRERETPSDRASADVSRCAGVL